MAKILIAEDDAHMLRILSMWLARNGHEVLETRDGQAAQDVLSKVDVDLIVSDVNMPRMSGIELVQWLRSKKSKTLPVIMLSSRCDQDAIAGQIRGCNVNLHPKPFSPSRLMVEVEQLLSVDVPA